jgi:hypothetical protein
MADHKIHHFEQLLKELENNMGRLSTLMQQSFAVAEDLRRTYVLLNEDYELWCTGVITRQ